MSALDRRSFLKAGAAAGALALGVGRDPLGLAARRHRRVSRVQRAILVAFAGGVRTRETLGSPLNVPNLMRMAAEGVTYTRARTANLGHFGSTLSLFTGIAEARGIRANARGEDPTLFEYVRKDLALSASEVWVSTSGGAQQANYSYSLHPDYGASHGANTLDGDGIFNAEFKSLLSAYGRPKGMDERETALLERLRGAIETQGERGINDHESLNKVERYILQELSSGTADLRGLGASDAKALRVARNLLAVFKPKLLAVVLQDADVAHREFNAYVQVIKNNDEKLGELWQAVKADPELATSTAVFVLPEFGRDADLNSRRGLDHGDGSDDLNYASIVAWGPGFRAGTMVKEDVRTIDVCPTICGLLGADARLARSKPLPKLVA